MRMTGYRIISACNRLVLLATLLALIGVLAVAQVASGEELKKQDISRLALRLPCKAAGQAKWQAGLHYNVLLPSRPTNLAPGRVHIREQSMYTTWITPDKFRSDFQSWLEENAARVTYTREPSIAYGMPHAKLQARMFYTLEELGRGDLHEPFRAWIQDSNKPKRWEIYHNVWQPDERGFLALNIEFTEAHGIDESVFLKIYNSEEIARKVRRAEGVTGAAVVQGTPTFVINGRYSVSAQRLSFPGSTEGRYFDQLLELIDYLTKAELRCSDAAVGGR